MSRKLLNWEIELEMGMNFIGDGNEEGKTRHTHSNVACKTIPAIRVFLSVSLKPAPPITLSGPSLTSVGARRRVTACKKTIHFDLEYGVPIIEYIEGNTLHERLGNLDIALCIYGDSMAVTMMIFPSPSNSASSMTNARDRDIGVGA